MYLAVIMAKYTKLRVSLSRPISELLYFTYESSTLLICSSGTGSCIKILIVFNNSIGSSLIIFGNQDVPLSYAALSYCSMCYRLARMLYAYSCQVLSCDPDIT